MSYPETTDGKRIVLINRFPGDVLLYQTGAFDGAENRGDGAQMELSRATGGDVSLTGQFLDWVYLAGGIVEFEGGAPGCWISLQINAPASTFTPNAGAGAVDLVATGLGFNIAVPNATQQGSHDVAAAVPVPNAAEAGFWNWDCPDTGLGSVTPNASQAGAFDLYDAPLPIGRFANRIPLRAASGVLDLDVEEIKPKRILPQWQWQVTLHHAGDANELHVSWFFIAARKQTT